LASGFRIPSEKRWRVPLRAGFDSGGDPLNAVSSEMRAAGLKYAMKLEDVLLSGTKLWSAMTEQGKFKKLYFVGPKGNLAEEVAESFMDSCAYIPAADGTLYMQRKQTVDYAPFDYHFVDSDADIKIMCRKQGVDHVTMYSEDEAQYREMETAVLKKFSEHDETKEPCAIVVGESALNQPENKEFLKEGIVIYLKCSPQASWKAINTRPGAGTGLYISSNHLVKPPVWALAQDLQGDIDNEDGREEYVRILDELDKDYEESADIVFNTDVRGISENSMWAIPKLIKLVSEQLEIKDESSEPETKEESMEKELTDFLEGARLSKYLQDALKWCDEQGAASIEDIVENPEDFVDAIGLKPLEKKRFDRACALVSD